VDAEHVPVQLLLVPERGELRVGLQGAHPGEEAALPAVAPEPRRRRRPQRRIGAELDVAASKRLHTAAAAAVVVVVPSLDGPVVSPPP